MANTKGTRLVRRGGIFYILWTGNSRGRSTGTSDRRLAEKALAAFISGAGESAPGDMTVADCLAYYMDEHVEPNVISKATAICHRNALLEGLGDRVVSTLREDDFHAYIAKRGRSDGTLRRELAFLTAAFNHNHRRRREDGKRRLAHDDIPTIPLPSMPPPRDRWLTAEEEDALLDACPLFEGNRLSRIYRFIMLALETAGRKEALETLLWFQVDLPARTIALNPPGRRQTNKRRAVVRISDRLHAMLTTAYEEKETEYVLDGPNDMSWWFQKVAGMAKLVDVTPHVLRHTWATRAARAGVPMRQIADMLGDNMATVERNYYHHSPDYMSGAVNWRDTEHRATFVPAARRQAVD